MNPRLKLNTWYFLSFWLQIEKILGLLYSIWQFGSFLITWLIWQNIEIVLENIDGFIRLESRFHFWVDIIQKMSKIIIFYFHGGWFLFCFTNLQTFVDFTLEVSLRTWFCVWIWALQSKNRWYCTPFTWLSSREGQEPRPWKLWIECSYRYLFRWTWPVDQNLCVFLWTLIEEDCGKLWHFLLWSNLLSIAQLTSYKCRSAFWGDLWCLRLMSYQLNIQISYLFYFKSIASPNDAAK